MREKGLLEYGNEETGEILGGLKEWGSLGAGVRDSKWIYSDPRDLLLVTAAYRVASSFWVYCSVA